MRRLLTVGAALAIAAALAATALSATSSSPSGKHEATARHVLLLSVDGMHQSDLAWYVSTHPASTLARLVHRGVEFTHARTPFPSDSFPGMVAQVTGGDPRTTGVYYDDTWNRGLLPAGTTDCTHATPGVEVTYFEQLDRNLHALDAGQGLPGLPGSILDMLGDPAGVRSLIDPAQLPVDPATCTPVYPHQYLKVNTIFELARAAGLRTAWSDKHVAYEILDGPSGAGIQDLFAPEINSDAPMIGSSNDWTTDNALTMQYDSYKVQAVLNEIDGLDHSGRTRVGTPAIFGMNFQTVSTAEKLPTSDGLTGGYLADGLTPGPLLQRALGYVDAEVGAMTAELGARHLGRSTVIILSAKHGQSPQSPAALTRIDDGPIIDAMNAAWKTRTGSTGNLVAFAIDDDGMLLWLNDRSDAAESFAKTFLRDYSGVGNDIDKQPKPFTSAGLVPDEIHTGADAARFIGVPFGDPRVPDVIGVAQYGTVYAGGTKKIAEHGGDNPQDRDVPLVVSGGPVDDEGGVSGSPVETTQIAPTILRLLGLDPNALQAVRAEHTPTLPLDG
jgi:type I phosphodiesterase/nucleotide pyrophosphatase